MTGNGFNTVTSYPSGFLNGIVDGINGHAAAASAELSLNTATETPVAFLAGSGAWVAATLAVGPPVPSISWQPWVTSSGWT